MDAITSGRLAASKLIVEHSSSDEPIKCQIQMRASLHPNNVPPTRIGKRGAILSGM
jgi:hypothetical protein